MSDREQPVLGQQPGRDTPGSVQQSNSSQLGIGRQAHPGLRHCAVPNSAVVWPGGLIAITPGTGIRESPMGLPFPAARCAVEIDIAADQYCQMLVATFSVPEIYSGSNSKCIKIFI
ncbi:hypothetical protein [Azotobacter chroococcum]|uniref:hypothetical protein n=1 Tax=Azotobacter chroococcum TaxID=353 RepID=UPI0012FD54BF|nr:hypothetical protein [Azotobacter chroococcum]